MRSIKLRFVLTLALLILALVAVSAVDAAPSGWWITPTHNDLECTHHHYENSIAGPFTTKADCEAVLTPTYGPVCENGETFSVEYPALFVYLFGGTVGECEVTPPATHVALPPQDSATYLCYSVGGNQFAAANKAQTQQFESLGYWLPSAVLSKVDGANNVGPYHLVCNAPGTQGVDGNAPAATTYADNNGNVLDFTNADSTDWVGVYPIVG